MIIKFLAIGFAAGFILGIITAYIWKRTHTVGDLQFVDHEEMVSVFLELEKELPEVRQKKVVTLRVKNTSYYENIN